MDFNVGKIGIIFGKMTQKSHITNHICQNYFENKQKDLWLT